MNSVDHKDDQHEPDGILKDEPARSDTAELSDTAGESAQDASADEPEESTVRPYTQNRELSWLDFNKRVLDQGGDPHVPLLDRLNFISIFWSNLQEFFMIRVGSLTDLLLLKKPVIDDKTGMTPAEQLSTIYKRCHELYPAYEQTYNELSPLLAQEGIAHLHPNELDDKALSFLNKHMRDNVMPFLSPQIVNTRHPFPHLENGRLYVIVRLNEKKTKEEKAAERAQRAAEEAAAEAAAAALVENIATNARAAAETDANDVAFVTQSATANGATSSANATQGSKNMGAEGVTLGIIPLPNQCDRLVRLPGKKFRFVLLEDVIEMHASEIFSMYKVKHTNVICVTRNADLDATEGSDEQGDDYREHMKRILRKRARLTPVRLECERPLSQTVKPMLLDRLHLKNNQVFVSSVPLDLSFTYELVDKLPAEKRAALTQKPFTPAWPQCLKRGESVLNQIIDHEVLLSYPYESIDPFVQLLFEAARDPDVISIEITLYRLANHSHVAEALIAAAEAGKEVTALFELRARFDESNNIEWSQRFEQAGCHVIYGFQELKVHSKICAITRQTEDGVQRITQFGTGNYNEKTARLYTDYSFITTDPVIGNDADRFFMNMSLENMSDDYDLIWVAPLQIKQNIIRLIDEQIELALSGQPCGLFFKTNSITDTEIIDKIVQASQAGVPVTMLVRSISCIVPGIPGYTDNVRVVSIVGRLLEHSRIYCFGPLESAQIYLSSADLMTRNLDKRIEIAWPILSDSLRAEIVDYLNTSMADTAKLRELLPNKTFTPLGYFATQKDAHAENSENTEPVLFDSQEELIMRAQRNANDENDQNTHRAAAAAFVVPPEPEEATVLFADVIEVEEIEAEDVIDMPTEASSDQATETDQMAANTPAAETGQATANAPVSPSDQATTNASAADTDQATTSTSAMPPNQATQPNTTEKSIEKRYGNNTTDSHGRFVSWFLRHFGNH